MYYVRASHFSLLRNRTTAQNSSGGIFWGYGLNSLAQLISYCRRLSNLRDSAAGAVSVLAAQGRDLGQAALTMTVFALGAALPLVLFGLASRQALIAWRGRLLSVGSGAKIALGILLIATGALILTGLDKPLMTMLLDLTPGWLSNLTTSF